MIADTFSDAEEFPPAQSELVGSTALSRHSDSCSFFSYLSAASAIVDDIEEIGAALSLSIPATVIE